MSAQQMALCGWLVVRVLLASKNKAGAAHSSFLRAPSARALPRLRSRGKPNPAYAKPQVTVCGHLGVEEYAPIKWTLFGHHPR